MKITKATFDCTIAMPGYANVKPGSSEIILEPGEEIEDAWSELNRRAQAWHRKEYPHLYQESKTTGSIQLPADYVQVKEVGIINLKDVRLQEEIEDRILAAESSDELLSIKAKYIAFPVKTNELYNKRMTELNSGRPGNFTEGLE